MFFQSPVLRTPLKESQSSWSPTPSPPPILNEGEQCSVEYLANLMKEQKQLAMFPKMFSHVERLLENGLFAIDFFCCNQSIFQKLFVFVKFCFRMNFLEILIWICQTLKEPS